MNLVGATAFLVAGSRARCLMRTAALASAWLMCSAGAASFADTGKVLKAMLTLVETDNDRTVDIRLGDAVRITLPENATTGYRWTIDHYSKEFIEAAATGSEYPAKAVGSGGKVSFLFKGTKAGSGEVALKQWRSWAGDASVTARFRVRINVQP